MVTKHDIAEYYSDPDVQAEILKQVRNKPLMVVQTPSGDKKVYRRNDPRGRANLLGDLKSDAGLFNKAKNKSEYIDDLSEFRNRVVSDSEGSLAQALGLL